jgi:hypothetical protein
VPALDIGTPVEAFRAASGGVPPVRVIGAMASNRIDYAPSALRDEARV